MIHYRVVASGFARFRTGLRNRVIACDGRATRLLIWLAVGLFLIGFATWATRAGVKIRREAWIYTRSIRFHGDVTNALSWGGQVLDSANQEMATSGGTDASHSSPSFWQIVRGEGRVYDERVNDSSGDYRLDYPPLRLLVMSLWTLHVKNTSPFFLGWPGPWRQGAKVTEEIVAPMLNINTVFTWLSSLFVFLLVWLWMSRGGRQGTSARRSLLGPRRPAPRESTPLIACGGLLLFPPLICVFFYTLLVGVSPAPVPPPMVTFSGLPTLTHSGDNISATIHASINPQGASSRWSVDWGTQQGFYPNSVNGDEIGEAGTPSEVSLTISNLPDKSTVYYRITARNDGQGRGLGRGVTHTGDGILLTASGDAQPAPPVETYNSTWLSMWQWLGIVGLFAALAGSIRMLPEEHRGWACGLLAAMLMWLSPAIMMDSHVWPQWEVWVLPPFLLAALLCSLDWWFTAGLVFGLGTMFKGQFCIGAPVLLIWPLVSMRWGALARMLMGAVLCTAVLVGPWLIIGDQPLSWSIPAVKWVVRVAIAVGIASLLPLLRRQMVATVRSLWGPKDDISLTRIGLVAGSAAVAMIAMIALILARWPKDADLPRSAGLWLFLGVLVVPWLIRKRWLGVFAAGVVGISIWLCAWLFHGDWAWELVGFEYGAHKFDTIAMGRGSNGNLASILAERFGWELHDQAITLHLPNLSGFLPMHLLTTLSLDGTPVSLELRQALIILFGTALALCAVGAAINDRRNHPRFLAALVAPWMLMPNLLGQMMCRYQLWGASLSALLIGISPGFTFLNVLASLLAAGMVANQILDRDPGRSPQIHQIMSTLSPDDGWIMLCMAALVFYMAVVPGRKTGLPLELSPVDLDDDASVDDFDFLAKDEPLPELPPPTSLESPASAVETAEPKETVLQVGV